MPESEDEVKTSPTQYLRTSVTHVATAHFSIGLLHFYVSCGFQVDCFCLSRQNEEEATAMHHEPTDSKPKRNNKRYEFLLRFLTPAESPANVMSKTGLLQAELLLFFNPLELDR